MCYSKIALFIFILLFTYCSESDNGVDTGSGNNSGNKPARGLFGHFIKSGNYAADVRVELRAYPRNITSDSGINTGIIKIETTDSKGLYHFKELAPGVYNLTAVLRSAYDTLAAYIPYLIYDSIFDVGTRELRPPGRISVKIKLDSALLKDAFCRIANTSMYAVSNKNGICRIDNVPPGIYNIYYMIADTVFGISSDIIIPEGEVFSSEVYFSSSDTVFIIGSDTSGDKIPDISAYSFTSPFPSDNSKNVDIPVFLSWSTDPQNNTGYLVYDVYIDTISPPNRLMSQNQLKNFIIMDNLALNSEIFWQVILKSDTSQISSPVWKFDTRSVQNTAPVINSPGNQVVRAGQRLALPLYGVDPDSNMFQFLPQNYPEGLTINIDTLNWIPSASQIGEHMITLIIMDDGKPPLTDRTSFLITVNDTSGKGLSVYYPFNGNAEDKSGNSRDGTVNGPVLAEDRFGNSESAFKFNGSNDNINLGVKNLGITSGDFTISYWFSSDSVTNKFGMCMLTNYSSSYTSKNQMHIYMLGSSHSVYGECEGCIQIGINAGGTTQNWVIDKNKRYNDGKWHHLAVIGDRSGQELKVYIDNSEITTWEAQGRLPAAGAIDGANGNWVLGFIPSFNYGFFGSIDEVRIYSIKLDSESVNNIANEGR